MAAGLEPVSYFDSSAIIIGLVLLGRWLEARAKGQHRGRHPAADRPPGADRPPDPRRRRGGRRARARRARATCSASGPATACPVDGIVVDGASAVDESMLTGEPLPVDQAPRRRGHRRDAQHDGLVRHARHPGRARHGARPDRGARPAGPGLQGADPAPGRPHQRGVRAGRPGRRGAHVRRLVRARPRAAAHARADRVHRRRDHRLPVRDGPRHAHGDHGRDRARRRGGDPGPRRRGARGRRPDRHGRPRQDRHAHRGPARGHRASWRCPRTTRPSVLRLAASLEQGSEHPLGEAIVRAARERGLELEARRTASRRSSGAGVAGTVGRARSVLVGSPALLARARRGRRRRSWARGRGDRRATAGPRSAWRSTAWPPGCSRSRTRSRPASAEAVRDLRAAGPRRLAAHRRRAGHGGGRRPGRGDRAGPRRRGGAARGQGRRRGAPPGRGPPGRDGRRRHQRRPGARPRRPRGGDRDRAPTSRSRRRT